ncbi:MAG: tRNA threonylcarbamoyladenosine dehydratase [Fibrobacter sp.]|jgi:tRNA A37 threonylcarbamoyladenosine dehydratase|uniref:tRNA threonylcarbamoyladenosine dehydratase n=1 Tax=Fibrobacter TaxID=832 RepID=UPI0015691B0F|nr:MULTISPECIES: tRNA threonylcarbamoyladenosine dehydratase [Fibrobacter]MBQ7081110.1 tRNA threonylcarbamoyladenosine dehydratase [Fibrobacter sp.]
MSLSSSIFNRTSLLLGDDVMENIYKKRVIIFGLGGVGSWCAESLIRSGIQELVLVDSDRVCITNVNRQLMATPKTVGQVKVEVLKKRLLEINPHAKIIALQDIYEAANTEKFELDTFDYIIDAIDSLENKMQLLYHASKTKATVFSSMGAALKMDPTRIKVAEFWKVSGCPLGRALRDKFKRKKLFPKKKIMCVYSDELLKNRGKSTSCGTDACMCPKVRHERSEAELQNENLVDHEWCSTKAQINGTMAHATAIFGFMIAGLVMQDIYQKATLQQ